MSASEPERLPVATRAAAAADIEPLGRIWHHMMLEHERRDPAFRLARDALGQWKTMTADLLGRGDAFVFVASGNDNVVQGFCLGWIARNPAVYALSRVGFISELGVAPSHRRRGVGRALTRRATHWFRDQEVSEYQLSTAHWNEEAHAFWRAIGGQPLLLRYRFALDGDGGSR